LKKKRETLFIFSTSKPLLHSTPPSLEGRSGIPKNHQNPRQLSIAPKAKDFPTAGRSPRHLQSHRFTTSKTPTTPQPPPAAAD